MQRNTREQPECDVRLFRFQNRRRWMNLCSIQQASLPADALFCFQHQAVNMFYQYYIRVSERQKYF